MMKKVNKHIAIYFSLTTLFLLNGCEDFLEIIPTDKIVAESYYQTDEHAIAAINAAYASLKTDNGSYKWRLGMMDLLSDNAVVSWSYSDGAEVYELKEGRALTTNAVVNEIWNVSYQGISRANQVIKYVGESQTISDKVKKESIGQAKFLRALHYFNLVRLYGDVPLVLEPVESLDPDVIYPARTPLTNVYNQIIDDLEDAAETLPDSWSGENAGRATAGAAEGLCAKVYLTLATRDYGDKYSKDGNEYLNAATHAKKVIDKIPDTYDLMPEYGDYFNPDLSNENCKESLFEVQMANTNFNMGGKQAIFWGPRFWATSVGGWGFMQPTEAFVSNYQVNDTRREASVFSDGDLWIWTNTAGVQDTFVYDSETYESRTGHNTRKYLCWFQDDEWERSPVNIHILRLPEIYLIYAEAQLALGFQQDADDYVNLVRERAGLGNLMNVSASDIWNERRMELAFENDRYFDLLRTNQLISIMNEELLGDFSGKITLSDKNLFWPIPQDQMDANPNLSQNTGY